MSAKSNWSIVLFMILSVSGFTSCQDVINEENNVTISVSEVSAGDTNVILTIYAPLMAQDDYIMRFDVKYRLIGTDGGQSEETTESHPIKDTGYRYTVEIKDLELNGHYRFNVIAVYGFNGTSNYFVPSAQGDIDVTLQSLAPQNLVTKELLLRLEGTKVANYLVQVDRVTSINTLNPVMHATIYPEIGNILPLQLIAGERYTVKIWYIDTEGKKSAINSKTYLV